MKTSKRIWLSLCIAFFITSAIMLAIGFINKDLLKICINFFILTIFSFDIINILIDN